MSKQRRSDTPTKTEAANLIRLVRSYGGLDGSEGVAAAVDAINAMSLSDAQQTLESTIGVIVGQAGDDLGRWCLRFLNAASLEQEQL